MHKAIGINFGHDAGIAVVSDQGIEQYISKERLSRCKAAYGWDLDTLATVLKSNSRASIAISTAQDRFGPIVDARGRIHIQSSSPHLQFNSVWPDDIIFNPVGRFGWIKNAGKENCAAIKVDEDWGSRIKKYGHLRHSHALRRMKLFVGANGDDAAQSLNRYLDSSETSLLGMSDCQLSIDDMRFDGVFLMHHLSHATYGFWASGLRNALVISYDGTASVNWGGGGYFFASQTEGVRPLLPGGFWMGKLYDATAKIVGVGEAGKLMGLAPYGEPTFFTQDLIGSIADVEAKFGLELTMIVEAWHREACGIPAQMTWNTYDTTIPRVAANVAASAQKIFEENILKNVETGLNLVEALKKPIDGIVLVGGGALNCPANSKVHQAYPHLKVFVPPACNDEGLALGNAVASYFASTGKFPPLPETDYKSVYLGPIYTQEQVSAAVGRLEKVSDFLPEYIAMLLRDGAIMGIFHGRSEIGPRALGHRSILASPLLAENWARVNKVKDREPWRPFAPICLESDMALHFEGSDLKSRFMLFTHKVKHEKLPAITHRDRSARAQAVNQECGIIFNILTAFKELTGYGVLVNTSFNGKNVPIVETPCEAVEEALRVGLDYFVCEQGVFKTKF
jgi:carbamoyltransferase